MKRIIVQFLILYLLAPSLLNGQDNLKTYILSPDSLNDGCLADYVQFLPDSLNQFSLKDILSTEISKKFISFNPNKPNYKNADTSIIESKNYWYRFSTKYVGETNSEYLFLSNQEANYISLFYKDAKGKFHSLLSGNNVPFLDRDIPLRNTTYINLPILKEKGVQIFYVHLSFSYPKTPFKNSFIFQKTDILENEPDQNFKSGVFLGIILIVMLYSLILFISTRELNYLYYIFYLFSFGFYFIQMLGFAVEYIYPNHPSISNFSTIESAVLMLLFYVIFTKKYLNIKQLLPRWNLVFNIQFSLLIFLAIFILFTPRDDRFLSHQEWLQNIIKVIMGFSFTFTFLIGLIPSIKLHRKKYRPARFFLLANLAFITGLLFFFIGALIFHNLFLTFYSVPLGSLAEMIIFSIGIGDKLNQMNKEKQLILEQQNIILEEKVIERTSEVVKQKEMVEEKQREILDSIEYALRIQTAILPPQKLVKQYLENSFILYKPKDIVAGDFYWMETVQLDN